MKTGPVPTENSTRSLNICYVSFHTIHFPSFLMCSFAVLHVREWYVKAEGHLQHKIMQIFNHVFNIILHTSHVHIKILSILTEYTWTETKDWPALKLTPFHYVNAEQFVAMVMWNCIKTGLVSCLQNFFYAYRSPKKSLYWDYTHIPEKNYVISNQPPAESENEEVE